MAAVYGITGEVTSWTDNARLIGSGAQDATFTAEIVGEAVNTTAFDATNSETFIPGLKSIRGTIRSRIDSSIIGIAGSVGFSSISYYATNIDRWQLILTRPFEDTTAFASTEWRSFTPGLINWSGTYEGFLDSSNAVVLPAAHDDSPNLASLTLTISSGVTFAGSAHITNIQPSVSPQAINAVAHAFQGSGNLTAAGDKFFDAGVIAPIADPSGDELVLKAYEAGATDRTYTGDAFWNQITIDCVKDTLVGATINWQGTGSWSVT